LKREPSNGNVGAEPAAERPDLVDELLFVTEWFARMQGERTLRGFSEPPPMRGRPPTTSWPRVEDIASRLESLGVDDKARGIVRQAVGVCHAGTEYHRERVVAMLREELALAAAGVRIPPLANVLLVMLDEEGCDRAKLVIAGEAAGVLGAAKDKRKNLSDRLVRTRKELRALPALVAAAVRRAAWWRVE
jgi:hypothetical protein